MTGPWMVVSLWRVKFLMRQRTSVDLPTFRGPTTATRTGGGSADSRSTTAMWCFFSLMSRVLNTSTAAAVSNTGGNQYMRRSNTIKELTQIENPNKIEDLNKIVGLNKIEDLNEDLNRIQDITRIDVLARIADLNTIGDPYYIQLMIYIIYN